MENLIVSMLFLTAVICQTTGQQAQDYDQLDPGVKTFVDQAILKANQEISFGHLNFHRIEHTIPQVPSRVRIDVRLKNTECKKVASNEHRHRPECPFKKAIGESPAPPLEVRCMVCPNGAEQYVDCIRRKDQKTRVAEWNKHCFSALPGAVSIAASTDGSTPVEPGCLGCF